MAKEYKNNVELIPDTRNGEKGSVMDSNAEKARKLLEDQHLAVLCTQGDSGPYASLMAYTYDRETDAIWIVTRKDSEKHRKIGRASWRVRV